MSQKSSQDKIINFKELLRISKKARKESKKIVFTNGCFRILTIAHIRCFQEARKYGDILVVGLNSDSSIKKLKGDPIVPEKQRAELLFPYVDYVYIFNEISPLKILKHLRPEIYVKGGDYKKKRGDKSGCREFVRSYGGKVILTKLTPGISTSKMIERIKLRK